MELLFRRNFLTVYSYSKTQCPGYDNCLHPGSIQTWKMLTSFKDEPEMFNVSQNCPHKQYRGPSCLVRTDFTIEEYENMIAKNTICKHPDEMINIKEYRCYKCDATLSSEKERHKCS